MTDDLHTLEAMQRAAFDAAFPGLPPGLNPDEARRRINAALAAVLPAHRRQVLAEVAGQAAPFGSEVVALAVQRLVDNSYLGEDDLDRDDLEEIARIVLTAATLDRPGRGGDGPLTDATPGAGQGERVDDAGTCSGGRDG